MRLRVDLLADAFALALIVGGVFLLTAVAWALLAAGAALLVLNWRYGP